MPHIRTELTVAASPGRVWSILTDVRSWSEWTSILTHGRGLAAVGSPLSFRIRIPGLAPLPVMAKVVRADPERALIWRGGAPGLLTGEHAFELREVPEGTRIFHHERFEGVLAGPLIGRVENKIERAYQLVNEDLRRRVEL